MNAMDYLHLEIVDWATDLRRAWIDESSPKIIDQNKLAFWISDRLALVIIGVSIYGAYQWIS